MAEDIEIDTDDLERRMDGALTALRHEFGSLRTGRASASVVLSPALVQSLNGAVQARKDTAFAADIRAWRPHAVAYLSDDDLTRAVTEAREAAAGHGIADPQLRARFVMLGVGVAPGFWRYREIEAILLGATGTPDIRFGDVCAMFAASLRAAGRGAEIWWR